MLRPVADIANFNTKESLVSEISLKYEMTGPWWQSGNPGSIPGRASSAKAGT